VVHPDGTITFTGTLTGRDVRICTSHRNVLLKDAGFLAIVDTVDSQGNFLSQELVAHGREHTHALASSPHRISLAGNAIQQRAHPDVGGYGRFGMHLIAASRHPSRWRSPCGSWSAVLIWLTRRNLSKKKFRNTDGAAAGRVAGR
jgi:hypothetical protein